MAGQSRSSSSYRERLRIYQSESFEEPLSQLDFFQFVTEVVNDRVLLMHSDSQILYANQAACQHLEYSFDELIGKYVWEWDPNVTEEDWPGMFQAAAEEKHVHFETAHRTKSGKLIPVEIHAYYYTRDREAFIVCICNPLPDRHGNSESELTQGAS